MYGSQYLGAEAFSVDAITIAVAFLVAFAAPLVRMARGIKPSFTREQVTADFLNGSVIYPFLLLVDAAFNSKVLHELDDARISVSLAGGVGLFFVVGELVKSCTPGSKGGGL